MCITCSIIAGEIFPVGGIIYIDDHIILHHCIDIDIAGYLIISPVRHVEEYSELHETEICKIGAIAKAVTAILRKIDGVEKIYLANFGEKTSHFHIHIFPRYKWMLDRHSKEARTGNKIDGAKLLSICRERYKVQQELIENDHILNTVKHISNELLSN